MKQLDDLEILTAHTLKRECLLPQAMSHSQSQHSTSHHTALSDHAVPTSCRKLISQLSHELNTPLQSILLTLDLLAEADEEDRATLLECARSQVYRMSEVLHNLHQQHTPILAENAVDLL